MELCRCSYSIMEKLKTKGATDKIHGLTINEIYELEKILKPNTLHKKVKDMEILGLVREGAKAGKAKTYFLTDRGIDELPEVKESEK